MIRIVVADDHKLVLNGIRDILKSEPDIHVVEMVTNGKELIEVIKENPVDVILTDIDMPYFSGLEVVDWIKKEGLNCKVVLLSVHDEKAIIKKAFSIGAYGYLLKRSDPDLILSAIKSVHSGKKFFDDDVLAISMEPSTNPLDQTQLEKVALLTNREKEIISLIVEGNSNLEIAEMLFLSKRTVDTHRRNLMEKVGLKNTVELVKFALKNGLNS